MLEVLKLVANWGFPAVLCIYLLWSFGKKLDKLDNTIGNHLTHALEENTRVTKEDSESGKRVETAMNKVSHSVDNLCNKVIGYMEKK